MSRILVTGGLGLIGSAVVRSILDEMCADVLIIDDRSSPNASSWVSADPRVTVWPVRVEDADLVQVHDEIDLVVHLAATVGVQRTLDAGPDLIASMLELTRKVAQFAKLRTIPLIFASSSEVYGTSPPLPVCENTPIVLNTVDRARGAYAAGKAASEMYLAGFCDTRLAPPTAILRFFNVSGPQQSLSSGMVLPSMIHAALNEGKIIVIGDGRQERTFLHVRDAARAVVRTMRRLLDGSADTSTSSPLIMNIGGTEMISMTDLAELIASRVTRPVQFTQQSIRDHYGRDFIDTRKRLPCIHRANEYLAWTPEVGLSDLVDDLVVNTSLNLS